MIQMHTNPASGDANQEESSETRRSDVVLRLDAVTKAYAARLGTPSFALSPCTLEIRAGLMTVITGRSGSGKTTLLQLMAGLDWPENGRLSLFGQDVTDASESTLSAVRRDRLGIVFQRFHLLEHLPVWQNVSCRFVPTGMPTVERRERALAALVRFEIGAMADRLPYELSGGERQRVTFARAVVNNPDLIIADEPTSNVDSETGEVMIEFLRDAAKSGAAVVVATHDPAVEEAADRRYLMKDGSLA